MTNGRHPRDRFPTVRKGYDPKAVEAHLERLERDHRAALQEAAHELARVQAELDEAREREEAVHLTLLAATRTKEEMVQDARAALEKARAEAETILGEARREAFTLVRAAREDAERVLIEAEEEARRRREEADTVLAEARREALALVEEARAEAAQALGSTPAPAPEPPAAVTNAVAERITELLRVTAALEEKLATLDVASRPPASSNGSADAASSDADAPVDKPEPRKTKFATAVEPPLPVGLGPTVPTVPDTGATDAAAKEATDEPQPPPAEEAPEPVAEDAPVEMPQETPTPESDDDPKAPDRKGSFYSRRSANLPRLGEDAGKGTLAAMAVMRSKVIAHQEEEGDRAAARSA